MKWNRVRALIRKDVKEVLSNKMVVLPMIIVPVILCVLIPLVILIIIDRVGIDMINGVEMIEQVIPYYSVPEEMESLSLQIIYIFLNYTFLPFFMIIPVMLSSIIAANSIVGEKERKTLETLLYTPLTNREFLVGKLLSAFVPAVGITVTAFVLYFLSVNGMSYALYEMMIVRSPIWIPAILVLSPSVSLIGLSVTLLVSLRAKTFMEAQQTAGIIVLPFVALVVIQITGLVVFKPFYVVLLSILLFFISYIVITRIGPRFNREQIISTL